MNKNLVRIAHWSFYGCAIVLSLITIALYMDYRADPSDYQVSLMIPMAIALIGFLWANYIIDKDREINKKDIS